MLQNTFSTYFLKKYQDTLSILENHEDYEGIKHLVQQLLNEDEIFHIEHLQKQLIESFEIIKPTLQKDEKNKLNLIHFYFAGADIPPFIPSDCWINGYANSMYNAEDKEYLFATSLFYDTGGFDLKLLDILHVAISEDEELPEIYRDLKWLFIYKTFQLVSLALEEVIKDAIFQGLAIEKPFYFVSEGGHDEDMELLYKMES